MKYEMIWKWTRFVVGVLMFVALMAIHVLIKDLHVAILAAPFGLMGFDAPDLLRQLTGQGGKK